MPFKLAAYHFAAQLTERAKTAGAVNTLIKKDDIIIGDNTDGCGVEDIRDNLRWIGATKYFNSWRGGRCSVF